ncbi:MAG TPA: hypothetical protein VM537_22105 [Anaerolineae bacterium]|nr:hypothetical protein [Anaerolineae bacterium]
MNEQPGMQAARLQVREGRVYIRALPDGGLSSDGLQGNWGCLYAVSHIGDHGSAAERVCDRVEDVAHESYARSPGGVTNRLRQAVRNANRYLYLRNLVRGEEQALRAALACVAIRGTDAYACGVGPHSVLVVSRGRVRSLVNHVSWPEPEGIEEWRSNGHALGRSATLSDPRFSYRHIVPGDLLLVAAGADAEPLREVAEELTLLPADQDIDALARELGELVGRRADASALLVRLPLGRAWPADVCKAAENGTKGKVSGAAGFFSSLRRPGKRVRDVGSQPYPQEALVSPLAQDLNSDHRVPSGRRATAGGSADALPSYDARAARAAAQTARVLQNGSERFRMGGMLLVSLLLALRAGISWLSAFCVGTVRRGWRWIRQHRVPEQLARGSQFAVAGLWAAFKGLLIGILPERQYPTSTYAASARPMTRARVLGFHPSGRSRAAIGALIILLVFALVGASAMRVKARLEQSDIESLASQVEESLMLSNLGEDKEAKLAALAEALELIDQAPASQRESAQLTELAYEVEARRDGLTGVMRLDFTLEQAVGMPEVTAGRIVVEQGQIYVLDITGQVLHRYAQDQQGHSLADEQGWRWDLSAERTASDAQILDIAWADAANGRLTPALLMLSSEGSIFEMRADGSTRQVAVADASMWQNPRGLATYEGNLYVLDAGRENILKYTPEGDDYQHAPTDYVRGEIDINWSDVTDMAIDGFVYLLLSDGSIIKFAGGQPQPFSLEGLDSPLENEATIFARPDCESVFVADGEGERIVEFSKEGQFVRQYRAAPDGHHPLGELGSFTVDVTHGRMVVGSSAGLFSATVPSLSPEQGHQRDN